jgi:hypothetical protein
MLNYWNYSKPFMWFGMLLHHFSHIESNLKLSSNLKLENINLKRPGAAIIWYRQIRWNFEVNSHSVRMQPNGEFNQKKPLKLKLREYIKSSLADFRHAVAKSALSSSFKWAL